MRQQQHVPNTIPTEAAGVKTSSEGLGGGGGGGGGGVTPVVAVDVADVLAPVVLTVPVVAVVAAVPVVPVVPVVKVTGQSPLPKGSTFTHCWPRLSSVSPGRNISLRAPQMLKSVGRSSLHPSLIETSLQKWYPRLHA